MTNYEDDEVQEKNIVTRIVTTIVFTMVAMIIVTSVALPLISTIGDRTETLTNTGATFTEITDTDEFRRYDSGSVNVVWNGNEVSLSGTISGVAHTDKILDKKDYNKDYPLILIHHTSGYMDTIVTYTQAPTAFTKFESGGSQIAQANGSESIAGNDSVYIQDPKGTLVMSKDGAYCSDPSQVVGFGYEYDPLTGTSKYIWADNTNATTVKKG